MKKIIVVFLMVISIFMITGCGCEIRENKPEEKVEELFEKYRNKDENIITQLKETVENEITNDSNKAKYEALMEKQYDSFSYVIKDTSINDDNAQCIVDITVLDYKSAIEKAEEELTKHPEKFNVDGKLDDDKYMAYKIELMDKVTDTVTYTLNINITKDAGMWKVDELTKDDIKKLHGMY